MTSTATTTADSYAERVAALRDQLATLPPGAPVRLRKRSSNLFRPRAAVATGLDVDAFAGVLAIDVAGRTADVLGMTTYEDLVAATLRHGLMPLVVPQLKTITLGGAVTGLGVESSSFRSGCPHESVLAMDIITGDGRIVTATPDGEHRALFYGFPNSYGTLGYALRLRIELEPVSAYVHLRHLSFPDTAACTAAIAAIAADGAYNGEPVAFLDGTVFSPTECYLTLGSWAAAAPTTSDYTGQHIYYRSIQQRSEDWLAVADYLWRWDTDWFWCSRTFGAQHPVVRRLWPRRWRRSDVYWKIVALERRYGLMRRVDAARGKPAQELVIQDVEVPVGRLPEFLEFLDEQTGIRPVWLCPMKQRDPGATWPLYAFEPSTLYVNVGFWSAADLPAGEGDGWHNRAIEEAVARLGGRKSLYSTAFYPREEFWAAYGGPAYSSLKQTYDPQGRLLDLYSKTVLRG
ncbi:MAG: FAD-binding oxidoreductase [Actinomycetota bacterium]|nr:FAD-binding oxidoreductase [Actinomycetota bacterium]